MEKLVAEILSYHSGFIMGLTWAIIEAMTPLVHWIVKRPKVQTHRVALYEAQRIGKRLAAAIWCSVLVWVPGAQPHDVCAEGITGECQEVFHRVAIGIILGVSLSGGHWGAAALYRKITGRPKADKKAELTQRD